MSILRGSRLNPSLLFCNIIIKYYKELSYMDELTTIIADIFVGNGLIIVLGCFVIGMFLKGYKKLPNKYIPYINVVISIILGFLIPDTYSDKPIVTKVILLAFLGLSSVGFYEIICTIVKKRFSINLEEIYNNIVNDEGQKDEERDESSNQTPEDVPRDDIDIDIE